MSTDIQFIDEKYKNDILLLGFKLECNDEYSGISYFRYDKDNFDIFLEVSTTNFDISCSNISKSDIDKYIQELDNITNISKISKILKLCYEKNNIKDNKDIIKIEEVKIINKEIPFDISKYLPIELNYNKDRIINIYVWGKSYRNWLPPQYKVSKSNNFNAAVLNDKKKGVDWRQCGAAPDVRFAVMQSNGFREFMSFVVTTIEKNNFIDIGVNCRKGRHRSSTVAHLLKNVFYNKAQLYFLEPGSYEQKKFTWE
jgi:hypothetical protein